MKPKQIILIILIILFIALLKYNLASQSEFPYGVYTFSITMINENILEKGYLERDPFLSGESPWLGIPNGRSNYPGISMWYFGSILSGINLSQIILIPLGIIMLLLFSGVVIKQIINKYNDQLLLLVLLILVPIHTFFNLQFNSINAIFVSDFFIILSLVKIFIKKEQKYFGLLFLGLILSALTYYSHFIINLILVITIVLMQVLFSKELSKQYKKYFMLGSIILLIFGAIYLAINQSFILDVFTSAISGENNFVESPYSYKIENISYFIINVAYLFLLVFFGVLYNLNNLIKYKIEFKSREKLFLFSWFIAFLGISFIGIFFASDALRGFEVCIVGLLISNLLFFNEILKSNKLKILFVIVLILVSIYMLLNPIFELQMYTNNDKSLLEFTTENNLIYEDTYTDLRFGGLILAYTESWDVNGINHDTDIAIKYLFYSDEIDLINEYYKEMGIKNIIITETMINNAIYPLNFPLIKMSNLQSYNEDSYLNLVYNSGSCVYSFNWDKT